MALQKRRNNIMTIRLPSAFIYGIFVILNLTCNTAYSSQVGEKMILSAEAMPTQVLSDQTLSIKKGEVTFQVGEKIGLFTSVCKISSVRFGIKYKCVKSYVSEGKIIGERPTGEWIVEVPKTVKQAAQADSENYSMIKDTSLSQLMN
jgi:hypothetical protein